VTHKALAVDRVARNDKQAGQLAQNPGDTDECFTPLSVGSLCLARLALSAKPAANHRQSDGLNRAHAPPIHHEESDP
jgi:hypothetical protein